MPKSYVGAYWGARDDGIDWCADSLAQLLDRLAAVDPLLAGWRNKGRSKREALAQPVVTTEHQELVARLSAGVNRRDTNQEPIEELGYSVGWWNGHDSGAAADLSATLGVTSSLVGNRVVLHLTDPEAAPQLYTAEKALDILHALIEIFTPDTARWTNHSLEAPQKEPDQPLENGGYKLGTVVGVPAGWANYFRDGISKTFDEAQVPDAAVVEHIGKGTLVHVGENPAEPELADVLQIRRAMGYTVPGESLATRTGEPTSAPGSGGLGTGLTKGRKESASERAADSSRGESDTAS